MGGWEMAGNDDLVALLRQGARSWNRWREANPTAVLGLAGADLSGAVLPGANLARANLSGAILDGADLSRANLTEAALTGATMRRANISMANLTRARLENVDASEAIFSGARFGGANLLGATLAASDLSGADLDRAYFSHANLDRANLRGADLSRANLLEATAKGANLTLSNLTGANLSGTDLGGADLSGAILNQTNLSLANLRDVHLTGAVWRIRTMRGCYRGVRGLDSSYGNALLKRAAEDQDFLDTLEDSLKGSSGMILFWAWGCIDYGRSLLRVAVLAFGLATLYGTIYLLFPEILDFKGSANTWFTPYYFSIVTYTTLGFGDVRPATLAGELVVSSEVVLGYTTLGLLLSVLAQNVARRS